MDEPFLLYGMDVSYFTGKLEAYLRYQRIPYQRIEAQTRHLRGRSAATPG